MVVLQSKSQRVSVVGARESSDQACGDGLGGRMEVRSCATVYNVKPAVLRPLLQEWWGRKWSDLVFAVQW